MKNLFILFVIAMFIIACGGESGPSVEDISKGKDVYKRICIACHGPNGELALNGAKKFPESILNLEERVEVITNGRNLMAPYKGILDEEEIKAVATYTIELTNKK